MTTKQPDAVARIKAAMTKLSDDEDCVAAVTVGFHAGNDIYRSMTLLNGGSARQLCATAHEMMTAISGALAQSNCNCADCVAAVPALAAAMRALAPIVCVRPEQVH